MVISAPVSRTNVNGGSATGTCSATRTMSSHRTIGRDVVSAVPCEIGGRTISANKPNTYGIRKSRAEDALGKNTPRL
jgi:hypothetical protein